MNKKILFLLTTIFLILPIPGQQKKLSSASVFLKDQSSVLIGDDDLYCSYEIVKRINSDIEIIGSEEMDQSRTQYSTGDNVFINKGSLSGLKEGDKFIIFSIIKRVYFPDSLKYLGKLIQKKGVCIIKKIFEGRAVVKLQDTCSPVELADNLIPFKAEEKIVKRAIEYSKSGLLDTYLRGKIIFSSDFFGFSRMTSGPGNIVVSNLGLGEVSKGDFVLFYKVIKKNLPKVVVGSGIVLKPQNNNSTIKIIDASFPIKTGEMIAVVPTVTIKEKSVESPPLIKKSKDITQEVKKTEESFDFAVLFNINESAISDQYESSFAKLKDFINSKSEITVILRGYACSIGGFTYNLELSKKRVEAVKNLLILKYNISEDLIETFFYGEKDSPFDNSSEESRRKNRRVDIQVIGK